MLTTGVVVGRFQVPELHLGHKFLLDKANENNFLHIFLGIPFKLSLREPLDFGVRALMLGELYPQAMIVGLTDIPGDDELWSKTLDQRIENMTWPRKPETVTLYGGRDSFLDHYQGKFKTEKLNINSVSGSQVRKDVREHIINSVEFRKGIIYSTI